MSGIGVKLVGAVAGCVIALGVVGCSGEDESPESEREAPVPTESPSASPSLLAFADETPLEPEWVAGEFIMEVGIFHNVAVVVAGGDPDMLTGVDVTSGEVLWETETNRGAIEATDTIYAGVVETVAGEPLLLNLTAPVLDPAANHYFHGLELLDPRTGEQVEDLGRHWTGARWTCEFEGGVCAWVASLGDDLEATQQRFNPDSHQFEPRDALALGKYTQFRSYAADIYGVQTLTGEELLVRYVDGEQMWSTPTASALGEGASASGPMFAASNLYVDDDVLILNGQFDVPAESLGKSEAADHVVAALDVRTGEVLWTDTGLVNCGPAVMCSGDLAFEQEDSTASYPLTTGEVTILGVNARTGQYDWTLGPVEVDGMINTVSQAGYIHTERALFLDVDGVTQVIDIATGDMHPLGADFAVCYEPLVDSRPEWSNPENSWVPTVLGGQFFACNQAEGTAPQPRFTPSQVEAIGIVTWQPSSLEGEDLRSERYHVVNTVYGLAGFKF